MKDSVLKKTLANGLTFLFQKAPHAAGASIGVWVKMGSRFERKTEMGYTHFLEHMLFKGTTHRTARQLAEEIERVGGYFNAATSREYTYYYVTIALPYIEQGFKVLSDMLFDSLLKQEDIQNEREVIFEEMRGYEDSPDDYVFDCYFRNIFPKDSLGRDIIGSRESVMGVDARKLRKFYQKHYHTERMILAISANLSEKKAEKLAEKYFSRNIEATQTAQYKLKKVQKSFSIHFEKRKLEQVNFMIGAQGYGRQFASIIEKILLTTILGGGMSSRLFQKIREEKGLCYSISCFPSSFTNTGLINISCGTSGKRFLYCLESILQELRELKMQGVTEKELEDAKSNQIGSMSIGFESPENRMMNIAMQELYYGKYRSFQERVAAIRNVNLEQINQTAQEIFAGKKLHLTGIGNLTEAIIKKIDTTI